MKKLASQNIKVGDEASNYYTIIIECYSLLYL